MFPLSTITRVAKSLALFLAHGGVPEPHLVPGPE